MSAYVIFDVEIRDLPRYQEYMLKVKPLIEAAGGRYLVRGGAAACLVAVEGVAAQ